MFEKFNPRRSIGAKIGLAIATFVIVITLGSSSLASYTYGRQAETNTGDSLAQQAYQLSDKLDRSMNERYRDIQSLVQSKSIADPANSVVSKQVTIDSVGKTYSEYSFIAITNTDGKVIASKDGLLLNQNVSARPWWQDAAKSPQDKLIVEDVHEAKLLAQLLPNPTNEPLRFIDIAGPLYDAKGVFRGVFGAHLSLTWVNDIRVSLLRDLDRHKNIEILVLAKDNTVLLGPDNLKGHVLSNLEAAQKANKNQNGWTLETWNDSKDYMTGYFGSNGYGNYQGLGWKILVREPKTMALSTAQSLVKSIIGSSAIVSVLAALVAWWLIGRLVRRLHQINEAARQITAGNLDSLPTFKGKDEVATLGITLNGLIASLRDKNRLQGENTELTRLNKLLVDRELKMVELKADLKKAHESK